MERIFRSLLIVIILSLLPVWSACATPIKSEPPMQEETTIVLGPESTLEQCLAESTTKMNKILYSELHVRVINIKSNIELILLVGDKKVSIPTIKEASINFSFGDLHKGRFATGTFNFLPTNTWLEAEGIKEQILEVRQLFKSISVLSLKTEEMDFNELTEDYLKKIESVTLNEYYLKDYRVILALEQFPREYAKTRAMREKEHFQIYFIIHNQHELDEWRKTYKSRK